MVGDAAIRIADGRGNAEEDLLAFDGRPPEQLADDPAKHRKAVRLVGVEHSVCHGPACFDVKHLGEFLGVVAGHHQVRTLHLMEHVFPL